MKCDNEFMQATVELPEAVLQRLEALARQEGAMAADLIRRLVEAHVRRGEPVVEPTHDVTLPLIPASETGRSGQSRAPTSTNYSRDRLTS